MRAPARARGPALAGALLTHTWEAAAPLRAPGGSFPAAGHTHALGRNQRILSTSNGNASVQAWASAAAAAAARSVRRPRRVPLRADEQPLPHIPHSRLPQPNCSCILSDGISIISSFSPQATSRSGGDPPQGRRPPPTPPPGWTRQDPNTPSELSRVKPQNENALRVVRRGLYIAQSTLHAPNQSTVPSPEAPAER